MMTDAEESVLTLDEIKKEPSEDGSDSENDTSFYRIDEAAATKKNAVEKDDTDGSKSDDDMIG